MNRTFNVSADCKPELHYMVDIRPKLEKIRVMIDQGQYFTINRARQYGKTTTLRALTRFLKDDYVVVSLDFLAQLRGDILPGMWYRLFSLSSLQVYMT